MESILVDLKQYGPFAIMLGLLVYGIWQFGQAIFKKLFDDDKGYVTTLVNGHIKFVEKMGENQDKQTEILGEMQTQNKNVDNRLAKIEEIQGKAVSILDKLSCSKNSSAPK